MDATPASTSANGFDAALKALEDLETSVAAAPAAALAPEPLVGAVALSEIEVDLDDQPAAITAVPFTEIDRPIHEPAPPPAQAAAEPAPTVAHPAPVPVASAGVGKAGRIAIGIALFSSVLSATGLIVAERTIMSAQLVVADARERAHQLEQANKLIRDLEMVRDKQIELLQQQQHQLANAPVSSAELQHRMETLQAALTQHDPMNRLIEAIQAGNSANAVRFNEFGMKMARVEAAMGH